MFCRPVSRDSWNCHFRRLVCLDRHPGAADQLGSQPVRLHFEQLQTTSHLMCKCFISFYFPPIYFCLSSLSLSLIIFLSVLSHTPFSPGFVFCSSVSPPSLIFFSLFVPSISLSLMFLSPPPSLYCFLSLSCLSFISLFYCFKHSIHNYVWYTNKYTYTYTYMYLSPYRMQMALNYTLSLILTLLPR